jgi:PKD repeat protein
VTLTVADSSGRTATTTKAVNVGAGQQPVANFTVSPAQVAVGQRVFFDGTVSTPPPGRTITRYSWNLGENTIVEGPRVETTYPRAGSYTVVLTVTDSAGATNSTTKTVTVN